MDKNPFVKLLAEVRRTHKTMGSFLDHIRGFINITFSIGLVPGAAWSYWTMGTCLGGADKSCCSPAVLSTALLLFVFWERALLKLLNYVSLVSRIEYKTASLPKVK